MSHGEPASGDLRVGSELLVRALTGLPTIDPGDDLFEVIVSALARTETELADGDVVVIASKIVSRAEGCFVDLGAIVPSANAEELGTEVDKDPRLVELILRESTGISRKTTGALIVRHRLGFVSANAGIDASNAAPSGAPEGTRPVGPRPAARPRRDRGGTSNQARGTVLRELGVLITDSWGRPFRRGTVGFAVGVGRASSLGSSRRRRSPRPRARGHRVGGCRFDRRGGGSRGGPGRRRASLDSGSWASLSTVRRRVRGVASRSRKRPIRMTAPSQSALSVVALAGGVGGARLVDGLDRTLPPGSLTVVVNTGDDFQHWGLHISPDLDTVMYTLAGLSPEDRGWGIDGDTFHVLAEAKRRGVDEWFQLGDRDLVTHLSRSGALARGDSLTHAYRRPVQDARRRTPHPTDDRRASPHEHRDPGWQRARVPRVARQSTSGACGARSSSPRNRSDHA